MVQHGACSCLPLKYTNIDIAGHLPHPNELRYSGNPVLALAYCYLIQGKCLTIRNEMPCEMQYVSELDCKPGYMPPSQPPAAACRTTSAPIACPDSNCQVTSGSGGCQEQVMIVEPACQPNANKRNGLNGGA